MFIFKFIFRTISLIIFFVLLIIGVAVWKGGEPFRLIGEGTIRIGNAVVQFGETVDTLKRGGEEVSDQLIQMKEAVDTFRGKKTEEGEPENKDEDVHKDQEPE